MKEKIKGGVISFIHRSIICLCILCVAFAMKRFFPKAWELCDRAIEKNVDIYAVREKISDLMKEIL